MDKIKSQKELLSIVNRLKKQGKKITTYSGSFDILHLGHIKSLKEAKKQGDVLIVLLNSDKSVKKYKGPKRPIVNEKDRAQMLSFLSCVDFVVLFDQINPKDILEKIKPDVHCNGPEWGKNCVERKIVEKNGGRIHILKNLRGFSTTALIEKILRVYSKPDTRAVFLDRDGTININEPEYLFKIKDFRFIKRSISALKQLSETDYKIIILTNQSGIGRGYFKKSDLRKLHKWMLNFLREKRIRIDKIYFCPHKPEDNCFCRKPNPGMVFRAVREFGINLSKSWLVGDSEKDIILGRETNIKTIKIGKKMSKKLKLEPNFYAEDLLEAVKIIKNYEK